MHWTKTSSDTMSFMLVFGQGQEFKKKKKRKREKEKREKRKRVVSSELKELKELLN